MFYGKFEHTIDGQGRVALPSQYRDDLRDRPLILAFGTDECLWLYAKDDYDEFVNSIDEASSFDEEMRQVKLFFTAGGEPLKLDSAGRIRIPLEKQDYARLDKTVTFIGSQKRIELWQPEKIESFLGPIKIDSLTKKLAAIGKLP
ncbi:MAG: hypothetical protein FWC48_02430 [Actinomycetia bacterium]|nr:hypothetical protein [Actinomycetes bacterium]